MPQLIIGFHAIEEQLLGLAKTAAKTRGTVLHCSNNPGPRVCQLIELATSLSIPVKSAEKSVLDALSRQGDHRGAILEIPESDAAVASAESLDSILGTLISNYESAKKLPDPIRPPLVLALDSITDPHNLGAILRSADKFGVDLVLLPQRRSAQESETVRKSSAGASAWIPTMVVPNLHRSLLLCRDLGFWVCGADMDGQAAPEFDAKIPLVVVMGSEGKGISRLMRECCDVILSIPCTGNVDSLNVSVACGILLYEARRQQGFPW